VSTQTPRPQTSAQASQHLQNLQQLGTNTLPQSRTVPPWQMVLGAVNDPLVLVPLAAVVPTSVARNVTDTMVIALVIAVNTTLAVPQEIGADRAVSGRVAVQHRKVRDTRLDAQHSLAHRIACDNQGIYVQDLAGSGLARTRLGKSVADAGWSRLVALLAGEGAGMRPEVGAGQCLVPLEPAVLGVWGQLSQETPGGQVLDLPAVWHRPRSGPERRQEHPG
jgi:Cation transporter/ATPase, N-terminus